VKLLAATLVLGAAGCEPNSVGRQATDPQLGERAYQKCYSCHALEPGRNELTGPTLHRIVGRPVAAEPGFDYSPALKRFAEREQLWTKGLLGRFAADPEALVPGTSMTFHGIADPAERAALIAYLEKH
jgi:cytochrome c